MSHNADVNAQTRRGDSPLHLAAYRGFLYISQALVMAGADLTLLNTSSMTPEMEASSQGHTSLAKYLRGVYAGENTFSIVFLGPSDLMLLRMSDTLFLMLVCSLFLFFFFFFFSLVSFSQTLFRLIESLLLYINYVH